MKGDTLGAPVVPDEQTGEVRSSAWVARIRQSFLTILCILLGKIHPQPSPYGCQCCRAGCWLVKRVPVVAHEPFTAMHIRFLEKIVECARPTHYTGPRMSRPEPLERRDGPTVPSGLQGSTRL